MVLLVILGFVFAGVALMVFFGEKHGKPLDNQQQSKYSKIGAILVFVLIIAGIIKMMMA